MKNAFRIQLAPDAMEHWLPRFAAASAPTASPARRAPPTANHSKRGVPSGAPQPRPKGGQVSTITVREQLALSITKEEAASRLEKATRRGHRAYRACVTAKTAGEYNKAVRRIERAADEIHYWKIVLAALVR